MSALDDLHNRLDLINIPFTDRGSRILLFRQRNTLLFRLAERWLKWEGEVGHYRQRPPIIENFTILDAEGHPLPFETDTYPYAVQLNTAVGNFSWTLLDPETLLVRLPAGTFGLCFDVRAEKGRADWRGGLFHGKRNVAYTTNARLVHNEIVPQTGGPQFRVQMMLEAAPENVLVLNITPRLGFNRSAVPFDTTVANVRMRWENWFAAIPRVQDEYCQQYEYAWWIMGAGLLSTRYFFTREAMLPSKVHYVGVWHWDQFFHAIAYRYVDSHLAEDQLRIVIDHQRDDGMLPDAIHDEGLVVHLQKPVDADVTKPPLLAWTALKLYQKSKHLDFLKETYEPITRWHNWWVQNNLNACGLCEYKHPFSSGLDDSPLWDEGMPVVAPDLNTYICLQSESLAQIAELIGKPDDAERYRIAADKWAERMIDVLWDEKLGWFVALHDGKRIETLTVFGLLPLLTGRLPESIVARLMGHLTDPDRFWTEWPLPTVSPSDPKFDPMQMWRGPT